MSEHEGATEEWSPMAELAPDDDATTRTHKSADIKIARGHIVTCPDHGVIGSATKYADAASLRRTHFRSSHHAPEEDEQP